MKEMIRNAVLGVATAGVICIGAAAQNSDQSSTPSTTTKHHSKTAETDKNGSTLDAMDRHFIRKAGAGGLAEVELGKLAAEKARARR